MQSITIFNKFSEKMTQLLTCKTTKIIVSINKHCLQFIFPKFCRRRQDCSNRFNSIPINAIVDNLNFLMKNFDWFCVKKKVESLIFCNGETEFIHFKHRADL